MPKALVIDDEAPLARVIGRFLERAGFYVETATSGLEGLKRAVAQPPDVAIVDIMMPDMDGYEVCRRLRGDPRTARVSIMVLTARGQYVDRRMALEAGADLHTAKPFNGKVLVQQIEELLAVRPYFEAPLGCQILVLRLKEGVGATTLATNLALYLAGREGYLAAVADMAVEGGQVGERLGLPPATPWLKPATKDANDVVAHVVRHGTGLFALPAPPLRGEGELNLEAVECTLQKLRGWHDFVVLDTPRDMGALAPVLLRTSWLVLLLLTPDPMVLRAAESSLAAIGAFGNKGLQIWPVLNMVDSYQEAVQQQAERALGLPVTATLPWSPQECAKAVLNHNPAVLSCPESPLARSLQNLGQGIVDAMDTQTQRRTFA
jgi:CheY-like chemotaxis protein